MKKIHEMADRMEDELADALHYAENYVLCKAHGNIPPANRYKEMASDELKHAGYVRDFTDQEIENIQKVYVLPVETHDMRERAQRIFSEKSAITRQMLS